MITFLQEIRITKDLKKRLNKILSLPEGSFDKEFRIGKPVKRFEVIFSNEYSAEVSVVNGDLSTKPHIIVTLFNRAGKSVAFLGPDFNRPDIRGAYEIKYLQYKRSCFYGLRYIL